MARKPATARSKSKKSAVRALRGGRKKDKGARAAAPVARKRKGYAYEGTQRAPRNLRRYQG